MNKVEYFGKVLIDLTEDNVAEDKMLIGTTAHNNAGEIVSGSIEHFDGSYECSGESTGGGGESVEIYTGTISTWLVGTTIAYYTNSEFSFCSVEVPVIPWNGVGEPLTINVLANTAILITGALSASGIGFDIIANSYDRYGYCLILPTSNQFKIELE